MSARRLSRYAVMVAAALLAGPVTPSFAGPGGGTDILIGGTTDFGGPVRFIATGDFGEGTGGYNGVVLDDTKGVLHIDCAEFREERDGSLSFFANASSGPSTVYMKITGISGEGLGSAMGGFDERRSSADFCGAALMPTMVEYTVLIF